MKDICPYCGKPNIDNRNTCAYCGEDLARNDNDDKEAINGNEQMAASLKPETEVKPGHKERTRIRVKPVVLIVSITLLAVVVITFFAAHSKRRLSLPYEIKTDMTSKEIDYILKENGYVLISGPTRAYIQYPDQYGLNLPLIAYIRTYKDIMFCGYLAQVKLIDYESMKSQFLEYVYVDGNGDQEHPSSKYLSIKNELVMKYGEPNWRRKVNKPSEWQVHGEVWIEDGVWLEMFYHDEGKFCVRYRFFNSSDDL